MISQQKLLFLIQIQRFIFDRNNGHHFLIGRDILFPLFHQGLSSSLFTPDPHVLYMAQITNTANNILLSKT